MMIMEHGRKDEEDDIKSSGQQKLNMMIVKMIGRIWGR